MAWGPYGVMSLYLSAAHDGSVGQPIDEFNKA